MFLQIVLVVSGASLAVAEFKELYAWSSLDWKFPNESTRREAIDSGMFNPKDAIPIGVLQWRNKVFITAPRWRKGIPATLNTVPLNKGSEPTSPVLNPYPDWSWHNNLGKCEGIASVFRLVVDKWDRLWVVDNGHINGKRVCPPQLLIFDLNTNRMVEREYIPESVLVDQSILINIVLDYGEINGEMFAYLADERGRAIIVYDCKRRSFWRIDHNYFYPDPLAGDYRINGIRFQLMDGIFGLALSPPRDNGEKFLYFNPMASYRFFYVSTRVLRNKNLSQSSLDSYHYVDVKKNFQSTAIAIDENGVLFYPLLPLSSIACWNLNTPFRAELQPEIDRNPITLEFVADVKIFGDNLWVLSNKFPRFFTDNMDWNDINYRVLMSPKYDAIRNTLCE